MKFTTLTFDTSDSNVQKTFFLYFLSYQGFRSPSFEYYYFVFSNRAGILFEQSCKQSCQFFFFLFLISLQQLILESSFIIYLFEFIGILYFSTSVPAAQEINWPWRVKSNLIKLVLHLLFSHH